MKRITIDGKEFNLVPVEAEILPNYPTINEIYDSVQPLHYVNANRNVIEMAYYGATNKLNCKTNLPTKEDAEHIAAAIQLINIAAYYNAMFPDEKKFKYFYYNTHLLKLELGDNSAAKRGQVLFTPSAAKAALANPNAAEVLNKYFRIK